MIAMDLASLRSAYLDGRLAARQTVDRVIGQLRKHADNPIWISVASEEALFARCEELQHHDPASLPLYGIPFAIKDNIDLAGMATTAGCPAFAYQPERSARVVQRLLDAGAIAIGKTNLDQFATGLVGTRSPYGIVRNSFDGHYLAGGSSSGSAVAVALGMASFALGTDTAGSGRIPAAFNNLVGYKPTLGLISTLGMVPACRSLDAISVFSLTAGDAASIASVVRGFDPEDPWSRQPQAPQHRGWSQQTRFRVAVPQAAQREFLGNTEYDRLFAATIERCAMLGGTIVEVDIAPLLEAARLLYEGPWVAERYLATRSILDTSPEALHPVTRQILEGGRGRGAPDVFAAQYRLRELIAASRGIWSAADVLLLPTAATHFTIEAELAEPLQRNSELGRYTNFVNLMDLAALAIPAGFTRDGLPCGVTLVAPAWQDDELLAMGARLHAMGSSTLGATGQPWPVHPTQPALPATIDIAVCGAHLTGLPLNHQLTDRGAWRIAVTQTSPEYRLYALPGGPPERPGLVRVAREGVAVEIEVWRMPEEHFGSFMRGVGAPLGLGRLRTMNGLEVCGFLCEAAATADATDISELGSWRRYLSRGPGNGR